MTVLGPKVTQTMRQTHLKTTFNINSYCNPRRHTEDRNCKKDTLKVTDH